MKFIATYQALGPLHRRVHAFEPHDDVAEIKHHFVAAGGAHLRD